ncbi:hypothetical protein FA10DRAFT_270057 [Acaromyces ingoldii]|uniref:Uncharacterized protein n=1 Tax=Acaromyces ingoldii TaxID=215250 RepID=A0A316YAN7_9BASI|nr:hypothetical protein FA10DRAFT_270057 [Acaromyces ingoldii]PWN86687.1 hypothetical protein FA10DRAFT_270057 [Acaromyces ingoldii]
MPMEGGCSKLKAKNSDAQASTLSFLHGTMNSASRPGYVPTLNTLDQSRNYTLIHEGNMCPRSSPI